MKFYEKSDEGVRIPRPYHLSELTQDFPPGKCLFQMSTPTHKAVSSPGDYFKALKKFGTSGLRFVQTRELAPTAKEYATGKWHELQYDPSGRK